MTSQLTPPAPVVGARSGAATPHAGVLRAGSLPGAAVAEWEGEFLAAVFAAGVVLGTMLRAIGRGFGSGILGLADASAAHTDNPTANARVVAIAVDRNAAARAEWVTAFLCGESGNGNCV